MMLESRMRWIGQPMPMVIAAVLALAMGVVVPGYVDALGDSYAKLMALPALIALTFLILFSRTTLLLLIVFLRATTESLFEASRFSIAGSQIGLGGLLHAFALLVAMMLLAERPGQFSRKILVVWVAFLAAIVFGAFNSPDPAVAIRLSLQWLSNFSIFLGAYLYVRTEDDFRSAVRLVLWSSIGPTVYGLVQFATGGGYDTSDAGLRTNSTFNHPNIFAFYLTVVISLSLYVMKSTRFALGSTKRWMMGLYILVLIALLILTKTRSAWVATFTVFVGYALLFERRYLAYIVLAAVVGIFIPNVGERIFSLAEGGTQQISSYDQLNSFAWRVGLWRSALVWMTPEHYLYGYGLEAFKWFAPTFFDDSTHVHWGAHNVYVQLIFDLGVVGLLAVVWMYAQVLLEIRKLISWDKMGAYFLVMMVIEFLVVAYSDNMLDYQTYNWYLWFITGAGMALVGLRKNATEEAH